MGFFRKSFEKLKAAVRKTRDVLFMDVRDVFRLGRRVDEAFLEELEDRLYAADISAAVVDRVLDKVREVYGDRELEGDDPTKLLELVRDAVIADLEMSAHQLELQAEGPTVILVCGVNGAGKTTSIAKLAYHYHAAGKKVLLAAGDTFRAAAVEQLSIWADRIGVGIVKQGQGVDPAAVAHDGAKAAVARDIDVLIVDTAGRLHTQANLMQELAKIRRVLDKALPGAPHHTLLVLDGTAGQNAVQQAKKFSDAAPVTGIFLTKLDGTVKGGAVLEILREMKIPVMFIGVGEGVEDIQPFEPQSFVDALFAVEEVVQATE